MTSPCSRIFSTTARDSRIRFRDSPVNSMRSFPVATAFNCASEIGRPAISTARSYLLDREMTKRGGSDLTNSSHRPITVRRRDDNIPQPATLARLNLTALSRQVLQGGMTVTVCVIPLIPNRADDEDPLDRPIG